MLNRWRWNVNTWTQHIYVIASQLDLNYFDALLNAFCSNRNAEKFHALYSIHWIRSYINQTSSHCDFSFVVSFRVNRKKVVEWFPIFWDILKWNNREHWKKIGAEVSNEVFLEVHQKSSWRGQIKRKWVLCSSISFVAFWKCLYLVISLTLFPLFAYGMS